ncbi:glucomannan 4-beta-mannosyltransferase 1 [Senna tora]|uniref:glucomannan 4-beta-mannosyltransferase n=1 Tax=Senna tora TaxID=362788 RepID=A0A834TCQ7_9FABA|nr:glucomannan 4-beta-mannosyltransferase 1 [Senna tora]
MRNLIFEQPDLRIPEYASTKLHYAWDSIRAPVIVPLLKLAVILCSGMSLMLFAERVTMALVILGVKLLRKKKYTQYKLEAIKEDLERNRNYPVVLIQIPMYNEKEVYKLSIGAACALSWPSDRLIVQVLDDSTNEVLRELVEQECFKWIRKGVNVKYETRRNRNGYKAGALKEGLEKPYVSNCEFVAIFDADFQPDEDFLLKTVPYLLENPKLGLVQARWKFVNSDECIMTRIQEMSLDYHFSVEQEVGSSAYSFFGFNGTAGVWRIKAIFDAGGWKDRTTVEDMDLAVRASLKGWEFVFVGDVAVKNELPSTFKAYRYQQHRWSCGPANLFKKMTKEIILCKRVSAFKRFHLVYAFFLVRKIIAHWVTFFFYCIVIPASVIVPEISLQKLIAIYVPATITILNALSTPRSLHLLVLWILFENVMSLHRTKAAIIGLLEANRVNEWVVTEKLGNALKQKNNARPSRTSRFQFLKRIHPLEIIMGMFMLHCAIYDLLFGHDHFFVYLLLQAGAFFTMGFGLVGTLNKSKSFTSLKEGERNPVCLGWFSPVLGTPTVTGEGDKAHKAAHRPPPFPSFPGTSTCATSKKVDRSLLDISGGLGMENLAIEGEKRR